MHTAPAVHAVQVPALQTMPVPHAKPFAALTPVSIQPGTPPVQVVAPTWQGSAAGVQRVPAVQATQVPLLHTRLVPHVVPSAALVPESVQTATPVAHEIVATWQRLAAVHDAPATQATHVPALHTRPVPHAVPFDAVAPVSEHTGAPVAQLVMPR
jgi:hypothetical protein